jgi:hypothetical protein
MKGKCRKKQNDIYLRDAELVRRSLKASQEQA